MTTPNYRLATMFRRIEAIGSRGMAHGDLADPLALEVRLTPADSISDIIESVVAGPNTRNRLRPIRLGVWIFDLRPDIMETGKQYVVHWRYFMTPENLNVGRSPFVWNPVPAEPYDAEKCLVYGTLQDGSGQPLPDQKFVVETYKDVHTLTRRQSSVDVVSDYFGNWSVEMLKDSLPRFIFGNETRLARVPSNVSRCHLDDLLPYSPASNLPLDRYGYPYPTAPEPR